MSVGKSIKHESAIQHVTGAAKYVDDQLKIEGLVSCWPVMSEYARAQLISINSKAALAIDGVLTVITAKDIKGKNDTGAIINDEVLLPDHEISYANQAIAWVVAESEDIARQAAGKVSVELKELKPILTIKDAIKNKSFHGGPQKMARGNPKKALKAADYQLTDEFEMGGQDHFYLETHASWVIPDNEGNYKVYSSTQHPSETQATVAHVLGIASNKVVCVSPRMGGGFGGKESQANPFAAIAALAAKKTARPARVRLSRSLDMKLTGKRHPLLAKYKLGFSKTGKIQALDIKLYSDAGWSTDLSHAIMQRSLFHIDNSYFIPDISVTGYACKTNKTSQTAFRGFGGPQSIVIIENIIDDIARTLNMPADKVRELNFYKEGQETHYGQVLNNVRLQKVWKLAKSNSKFSKRQTAIRKFNAKNKYKKRGLAITPLKFGISFTFTILNQAGAFILIYTDGSIQLNHGGTEMGQGLHTKMLQVAAASLGVSYERFRVMPTATD
ncbi:MAG TPA: xanthine dehydrogenase molybdopterin binding subunit, partial [Trueperaceae bacterium]|nr:xanthine dehydrogenase molybdopterin binding subunit [Trueperaceae bacterium]